VVACFLGKDEMAYLKTEDPFEISLQTKVLRGAWAMWREEMAGAIANGVVKAFGGGK
jgi:hypothetical protein